MQQLRNVLVAAAVTLIVLFGVLLSLNFGARNFLLGCRVHHLQAPKGEEAGTRLCTRRGSDAS